MRVFKGYMLIVKKNLGIVIGISCNIHFDYDDY